MSDFTIGAAQAGEAERLADILGGWIGETPWMPQRSSHKGRVGFLEHLLATTEVSVARRGGEAVGFMSLDGEEIEALYLVPEARSQGLGSRFTGHAKAGRARVGLWTYQANRGARRFYLRHGFSEIEHTDGDNMYGLPDVYMEWRAPA